MHHCLKKFQGQEGRKEPKRVQKMGKVYFASWAYATGEIEFPREKGMEKEKNPHQPAAR